MSMALEPVDPQGVMQMALWTPTSLTLPEDTTFSAWEEFGRVLGRMERSVQWWIGDWVRFGEAHYGEMYSQAIEETSRDYGTLRNYVWVAERFRDLSRRRDNLSFAHHQEVAALSPGEQDALLDQAEAEDWSSRDLRTAVRRGRVSFEASVVLPPGRYSILLADPPWRYEFVEADNRAIENQYPTLTADEIASFTDAAGRSVGDVAADDSLLFMWATNPKLEEALSVIEGWGFTYRTNLVWVKDKIGMGYWARQRHELLLVARRGEFPAPPEALRPDSVIEAPRTRHSEKPVHVHELIESIWPDAAKLEIFARSNRDGWAAFGNQVAD